MCGVHAQVQASAELQLAARVDGIVQADVRAALWERRALVKAWTIRGTLHLHPADELPLWYAARRAVLGSADKGLPAWRDPAGVLHAGGRRRRGRGGSDGGLGGAGRSLPSARRARRGGRRACRRRCCGSGCVRGSPSSSASCARDRREGSRITLARPDQWIEGWRGGRRRGRGAARGLPAVPAHVRPRSPRRLLRVVLLGRFQGGGGAGAVREPRSRPRGDRRRRSTAASSSPATVVPGAEQTGAAAAGVRRLRDGVSRARSARAAAGARAGRESRPRSLRRAGRGAFRAGRRGRRRAVGAPEARHDGSSSRFGSCAASARRPRRARAEAERIGAFLGLEPVLSLELRPDRRSTGCSAC